MSILFKWYSYSLELWLSMIKKQTFWWNVQKCGTAPGRRILRLCILKNFHMISSYYTFGDIKQTFWRNVQKSGTGTVVSTSVTSSKVKLSGLRIPAWNRNSGRDWDSGLRSRIGTQLLPKSRRCCKLLQPCHNITVSLLLTKINP